jgi:heptosyltransferase III
VAGKRGKILVIRGGAIGDFILTLPAISALRSTFADTYLEVLGYPVVAELAQAGGLIDSFRSIEARPLARFFARDAELDRGWSDYFGSIDLIISYLYDPDALFKSNVGRTTKAQFIQGPHRPNENENLHATAVFLKPLEQLAIFNADSIPRLAIPSAATLPPGCWVAAHPGSGSETKNWSEENWLAFLHSILGQNDAVNILLVGGEAESERLKRLMSDLAGKRVRLAQNLPLAKLAGLLSQCRIFIGHDSGITHLAGALGLVTLVLWGPSNEEIWRPLNPGAHIIKSADGLSSLSVDTVMERFIRALS